MNGAELWICPICSERLIARNYGTKRTLDASRRFYEEGKAKSDFRSDSHFASFNNTIVTITDSRATPFAGAARVRLVTKARARARPLPRAWLPNRL
jgi:hypothetical protein